MSHKTHYLLVDVSDCETVEDIEYEAVSKADEVLLDHFNDVCDSFMIVSEGYWTGDEETVKKHFPNGVIVGMTDPEYIVSVVEKCAASIDRICSSMQNEARLAKASGNERQYWFYINICSKLKLGYYDFESGYYDTEYGTSTVYADKVRNDPQSYAIAVYDLHI